MIIQAGALGLPSIVTDISGCNEVIINNENGVIIPKRSEEALYIAMRDIYLSPQRWQDMASRARDMVAERYEQTELWNALLEMYNNL